MVNNDMVQLSSWCVSVGGSQHDGRELPWPAGPRIFRSGWTARAWYDHIDPHKHILWYVNLGRRSIECGGRPAGSVRVFHIEKNNRALGQRGTRLDHT